MLAELALDPFATVRELVAKNPNTQPETLELLADDPDFSVRVVVARNFKTPPWVVAVMADDEQVWPSVASNHSAPPEVLQTLAVSDSVEVRKRLAYNDSLPLESFAQLLEDPDEDVRDDALNASGPRICATFGIDKSNTAAIEYLLGQEWWAMEPDDPAVVLARTLWPNT